MSVLEEGALGRDANILGATSAGCVLGQDQGILKRSQSMIGRQAASAAALTIST